MKKALCFGPRDLRIVEVPEREPGPGEVKSRMVLTTLTTANTRLYTGPLVADLQYPVTLSYTGVGVVEAVGPGVTRVRPGDKVYPNWYRACGQCPMCRADRAVACVRMPENAHNMMIGEHYESGLQEYTIFPEDRLWLIPQHVPFETASLIGALSVAMHATSFLSPEPGDSVLVVGTGPIGWGIIQIARLRGAHVVATDIRAGRLEVAKCYGAEVTLYAGQPELKKAIVEACGGPPLLVADASGTAEGSRTAFDAAGRGARLAVVGVTNNPVSQHFLILKGLAVAGIGGGVKYQRVIDLVAAGELDLQHCITHRYPFLQLREAFERRIADPEAVRIGVDVGLPIL